VVSNVDFCPFCGKTLLPVYQRLWFWLIVVILLGSGMFLFVFNNLPEPRTDPPEPARPISILVLGPDGPVEGASIKDLSQGTTVAVDGLEITVTGISEGPVDSNGRPLQALSIVFVNTGDRPENIYSTQWRLQDIDGQLIDTYPGSTISEEVDEGNFVVRELPAGGEFAGVLYFACDDPVSVVFQPGPLVYDEDLFVTWRIPPPAEAPEP